MSYEIKFAIIPATSIQNDICPPPERIEEMSDWFVALEKSILKDGIKNPVVITATKDIIIARYGGSRIMFAQKYDLNIPAIIADFDNIFPDAKVIESHEVGNYFTHKPKHIKFKPHGINISGCEDFHHA